MNKKKNNKKKYWFYLDTYVHISLQKEKALFYNSLTGKALEYQSEPKILRLVKKMLAVKNFRMILLKEKDLEDPVTGKVVFDLRGEYMADLIDCSLSEGKPVQMVPIVKIQNDIEKLKKSPGRSIGEDMMQYISEISFYVNNACGQSCKMCGHSYKQFPCCTVGKNEKSEMEVPLIKKVFRETAGSSLVKINITGGDIFKYSSFEELVRVLRNTQIEKNYFSHYKNILNAGEHLKLLDPEYERMRIFVTSPLDRAKLETAIEVVKQTNLKYLCTFIIQDESEFNEAEDVVSKLNVDDYEFQPFYNGENLSFFKENIFIDKDEILGTKPSMKDIYQNMKVNNLDFGRIVIFGNGNIHANVNAPMLGILGRDSIYDAVYKEMNFGKSWRRIRKNVSPCKQCTFQAICPPLSNYNYAIGKNDLCHIHV